MKFLFTLILILLNSNNAFTQQATLVEVDKVILEELNQTVTLIGNITSKKNTNIMSAVSGIIDKVFVEEGDQVKKGDILANIDLKNYIWQNEIAVSEHSKAQAYYENSKTETLINYSDLKRMEALKNSSVFNLSNFEKLVNMNKILKSNEKVALAEVSIKKNLMNIAKLNISKSQVKATFNGIIDRKLIEVGEVVPIGSTLFQLVSKDDLEVYAEIPSYRAEKLSIGNNIKFKASNNLVYSGIIRSIGAQESIKTRTTKIYIDFKNSVESNNLLINQSIDLYIPIGLGKKTITIHKDAILKRERISLAYVVKNDNKVEIRPLKLGEAVGNRFIVLEGVKKNENVVIKGNERLRPGQEVKVLKNKKELK
jgi:RND family efflux transporter MFP subunit